MSHRSRAAAISAAVTILLAVVPGIASAAGWLPARDASERGFQSEQPAAAVGADDTTITAWVRTFRIASITTRTGIQYRYRGSRRGR